MIKVGETGPGGGVVFHDAGSAKPWGRYLEVAGRQWHGTPTDPLMTWSNYQAVIIGARATGIGTGAGNTKVIVGGTTSGAAHKAAKYHGGGLADWYLPSKAELNAMFEVFTGRSAVTDGGLQAGGYWSSSEFDKDAAWAQSFDGVHQQDVNYKFREFYVRPIRAF